MADKTAEQLPLPFAAAQGSYEEEKNLLGLALLRVHADLHLAQFMLWMFNATEAGAKGPLKKSYEQLAARPWGLCCSAEKARATVREARRRGLIRVVETTTADGGQSANAYSYDRVLIRDVLRLRPPGLSDPPPVATDQGEGLSEHPPVATDPRGGPLDQALIGTTPLLTSQTPFHTSIDRSIVRPKVQMLSPDQRRLQIAKALDDAGVWRIAELCEARARRIVPLPAQSLEFDPLAPLKAEHLSAVGALTRWFRRQLSIEHPFTGDTEAELLLVLAAGLAVAAMPERDIQKTRMHVFKATVARRIWRPVKAFLPTALGNLQQLTAAYPLCLTHPDWPGPKATELVPTPTEEPVSCPQP